MPGPRQPLAVLEGNGRKHLSAREKAERAAGEVRVAIKAPSAPKWMKAELKAEFRKLAKLLERAGLISGLDGDCLARYVVAQYHWRAALRHVEAGLEQEDAEAVAEWSAIQDRFFKQARNSANDMGLTITSRCRLVLPGSGTAPEENPLEALLRSKRESRNHA